MLHIHLSKHDVLVTTFENADFADFRGQLCPVLLCGPLEGDEIIGCPFPLWRNWAGISRSIDEIEPATAGAVMPTGGVFLSVFGPSDGSLIANLTEAELVAAVAQRGGAVDMGPVVYLHSAPIFTLSGLTAALSLVSEGTAGVLPVSLDPGSLVEAARAGGATVAVLPPSLLGPIVDRCRAEKTAPVASMAVVFVGDTEGGDAARIVGEAKRVGIFPNAKYIFGAEVEEEVVVVVEEVVVVNAEKKAEELPILTLVLPTSTSEPPKPPPTTSSKSSKSSSPKSSSSVLSSSSTPARSPSSSSSSDESDVDEAVVAMERMALAQRRMQEREEAEAVEAAAAAALAEIRRAKELLLASRAKSPLPALPSASTSPAPTTTTTISINTKTPSPGNRSGLARAKSAGARVAHSTPSPIAPLLPSRQESLLGGRRKLPPMHLSLSPSPQPKPARPVSSLDKPLDSFIDEVRGRIATSPLTKAELKARRTLPIARTRAVLGEVETSDLIGEVEEPLRSETVAKASVAARRIADLRKKGSPKRAKKKPVKPVTQVAEEADEILTVFYNKLREKEAKEQADLLKKAAEQALRVSEIEASDQVLVMRGSDYIMWKKEKPKPLPAVTQQQTQQPQGHPQQRNKSRLRPIDE